MPSDQSMTHAITQAAIQYTKAAIMAMRKAEGLTDNQRPTCTAPRASVPALSQPRFDWKAQDEYNEVNVFKIEVRNIFMLNIYNIV